MSDLHTKNIGHFWNSSEVSHTILDTWCYQCVSKCVCGCTRSQWSRCWVLSLQMTLEDFPTRCGMAYSPPRFQNKGLKIKSVLSLSSVKTIKHQSCSSEFQPTGSACRGTVRMCWVSVIIYKIFAFQKIWIQTCFKFKGRVHPPFSFTHPVSGVTPSLTSWMANPMILRCLMQIIFHPFYKYVLQRYHSLLPNNRKKTFSVQ